MTEQPEELYRNFEYVGPGTRFAKDIVTFIDDIAMFQGLQSPEVWMIARKMSCYRAQQREVLLREGASGDFLLLLLSGEVEIRKRDSKGVDHRIGLAKKGMTIGEMSLVDGAPRFATCVAATPVEFAVLSRSDLNELIDLNPRLCAKFLLLLLQMMTGRLREASNRMLNMEETPLA